MAIARVMHKGLTVDCDLITDQMVAELEIRLYVNDYTPTQESVIEDFEEAEFTGYVAHGVGEFAAAEIAGDVASATQDVDEEWMVTLTSGTDNVYGFFITDSEDNVLYAGRDPNAPVRMQVNGDEYSLKLTLTVEEKPIA